MAFAFACICCCRRARGAAAVAGSAEARASDVARLPLRVAAVAGAEARRGVHLGFVPRLAGCVLRAAVHPRRQRARAPLS